MSDAKWCSSISKKNKLNSLYGFVNNEDIKTEKISWIDTTAFLCNVLAASLDGCFLSAGK